MGIGLTEEHRALAASVRGLVERTDDHAALARQGLLGLHLPEEWGGQGYGLLELCVALEALAEHRVTGPYLATVLTSAVLARARGGRGEQYGHPHADDDDPGTRRNQRGGRRGGSDGWRPGGLIPALADGSLTAAVALPADAPAVGTHPAGPLPDGPLPAGPRPVGPMLAGSAPEPAAVPGPWLALGPADAGLFLVPMGGGAWAVLDPEDVAVEPADGIDLDRALCHVTPRGPVPDDRVLAGAPVREIAAVLLGADACGVAAWAVATASAYAQVREQFGRPIGQFQGVKHRVAAALVALEQARAAVWDAARALDAPPAPHPEGPRHTTRASDTEDRRPTPVPDTEAPRHATPAPDTPGASALADDVRLAVGVAGVLGTDAGVRCAGDAIQVLGGIGYTFEHDAHRYYRRALSDRMLAGDPGLWAEEVAELAVAGVRRAMEPDLPEEAAAVRDTVRAAAEALRAEAPAARRTRMAEEGWIMPYLPEPWGRGASPLEQVVIQQEFGGLGRPNLGIGAWAAPSIVRYGTREQQERFVPGTLTGEIVWCQLFSEPGAGSDLAGLSTKATRVEGGWSLTGQKIWTSLAQHAHWGICLARTAPERPKHDGISYFLVDMSSPGVTVRPLREINGDEIFNEVFLDDVFVPDDLVVGGVNEGWRVARDTLSYERVALGDSWGPGSRHTDMVTLVARLPALRPARREQVGRLWAEGQAISALGLRVTLARLSGGDPGAASSVRKLLGMRHAQAISEFCWSLAPTDAYWSRMILATRAFTIGGGTTEVQLNIIAERALGLPRDP